MPGAAGIWFAIDNCEAQAGPPKKVADGEAGLAAADDDDVEVRRSILRHAPWPPMVSKFLS